MIAVKSDLNCKAAKLVNCVELEQTAVQIVLPHFSLYVCCIYIRPNTRPDIYTKHVESVEQIQNQANAHDVIVCIGDYNLKDLIWRFDEDVLGYLPTNVSTEQEIALVEPMLTAGLHQVNNVLNVNGRLLDLVFASDPCRIDLFESPSSLLKIDAHHKPIILCVDARSREETPSSSPALSVYDFTRCDYQVVNELVASQDWNQLLNQDSIDDSVAAFYCTIDQIIREAVPVKPQRPKKILSQPWWTPQLRNLRNRLRKARKRYFRNRNPITSGHLKNAEEEFSLLQRDRFREYTDSLQANFKQDPSSFWAYINKRKSTASVPADVSFRSRSSCSPDATANLFAEFFGSVYNENPIPVDPDYINSLPSYNLQFPQITLNDADIRAALSKVDASKGPGPDLIPPIFVKQCAQSLASPIASIYNRSLMEGVFPEAWKLASITPVHKSGNIHDVENYRPISILSCLGKVFEGLLHDALYPVVQSVISEHQHGFVKKRSTTTNLMMFTHTVIDKFERKRQVDAIYVDFSKAFDKVPHDLAIAKLNRLGLPHWIIQWLKSYLTSRKAFVKIHDAKSNIFDIPSGVPQGSHLGPLIFVLFINDLCDRLQAGKLLYADDLKLFRVVKTILDCCALQADIERVSKWCDMNGMQMNANKCKVISFNRRRSTVRFEYSLDSNPLERVSSIKDLGVILDSKLRFDQHVAITTAKANAMLGFLRRNTQHFDDIYALKSLYCALVRSVLEYGVQVWAPYHAVYAERIERVQKRFIRYALRGLPWNDSVNLPPYNQRCALIDMESLANRRTLLQRLFVFDVVTGKIDCSCLLSNLRFHAPARRLRNSRLLWIPIHRSDYGYHSPFDSCCRLFNDVCDSFDFNISKLVFKNRIKSS